jgi:hypothetical protein
MKSEMLYMTFECYHLNEARTRPEPEHYLSYQAQSRHWKRGRAGTRELSRRPPEPLLQHTNTVPHKSEATGKL